MVARNPNDWRLSLKQGVLLIFLFSFLFIHSFIIHSFIHSYLDDFFGLYSGFFNTLICFFQQSNYNKPESLVQSSFLISCHFVFDPEKIETQS